MMNIKLITIKKLHQLMKSKNYIPCSHSSYFIPEIVPVRNHHILDQRSRDSYNWTTTRVIVREIGAGEEVTTTIDVPYRVR